MTDINKMLVSIIFLITVYYNPVKAQVNIEIADEKQDGQEIVYTNGEVTYNFKSNKVVDFNSSKTVVFPDSTDALLTEIRGDKRIEAEIRVIGNEFKLLFVQEGFISEYYKGEDEWLSHFFRNIIKSQNTIVGNEDKNMTIEIDTTEAYSYVADNDATSIDIFLNTLKSIVLEKDRTDLLSSRIKKGTSIKEQKKIIGFIFSNYRMEQNKIDLINQLLDHPSYSKENNDFLMSFLDQLGMESNKVLLVKKLL